MPALAGHLHCGLTIDAKLGDDSGETVTETGDASQAQDGGAMIDPICTALSFQDSPDGKHRYWQQWRTSVPGSKVCLAILFNPTGKKRATGEHGTTIRNCLRFAEQLGCGVLRTCNLFSRKDYPDGETREPLPDPPDPVDVQRENDRHIAAEISRADIILCAWGNVGSRRIAEERANAVLAILREGNTAGKLWVLALNKSGQPKHPARASMRAFPMRIVDGRLRIAQAHRAPD